MSDDEPRRDEPRPMSSALRVALIVNAIVVAIAAATAIALIVVAWG